MKWAIISMQLWVRPREAVNLRLKHGGHGCLLCTLPSGIDIFDLAAH